MSYSLDALVNDFALRSFRETADKDYIAARIAYRARLIQPFLWSSLHCLEKYAKCVLILNRIKSEKGHTVLRQLELLKQVGKFEAKIDKAALDFIVRLEEHGAALRYYEMSYFNQAYDIMRLDNAVSQIRRYCRVMDYAIELEGTRKDMLASEIGRNIWAADNKKRDTCISGGYLEAVLAKKDHPARAGLVYKNLFFGTSHRKAVLMRSDWEAGNSPFFLHPEIVDEVAKYVYIPGPVAEGARQAARKAAAKSALKMKS